MRVDACPRHRICCPSLRPATAAPVVARRRHTLDFTLAPAQRPYSLHQAARHRSALTPAWRIYSSHSNGALLTSHSRLRSGPTHCIRRRVLNSHSRSRDASTLLPIPRLGEWRAGPAPPHRFIEASSAPLPLALALVARYHTTHSEAASFRQPYACLRKRHARARARPSRSSRSSHSSTLTWGCPAVAGPLLSRGCLSTTRPTVSSRPLAWRNTGLPRACLSPHRTGLHRLSGGRSYASADRPG